MSSENRTRRRNCLECVVCGESRVDSPTLRLPCFHLVCSKPRPCYDSLLSAALDHRDTSLKVSGACPDCNSIFNLEDVVDAQNETQLLSEDVQMRMEFNRSSKLCNHCVRGNKAGCWCKDCMEYLCIACAESHELIKAFREHRKIAIGDPADLCEMCLAKEAVYAGTAQDKIMAVCFDCIQSDDITSVIVWDEYVGSVKKECQDIIDKLNIISENCQSADELLEESRKRISEERLSQLKNEVTELQKLLLAYMLTRISEIKHTLNDELSKSVKEHNLQAAKARSIGSRATQIAQMMTNFMDSSSKAEIVQALHDYKNGAELLMSKAADCKLSFSAEQFVADCKADFALDINTGVEGFSRSLAEVGSLTKRRRIRERAGVEITEVAEKIPITSFPQEFVQDLFQIMYAEEFVNAEERRSRSADNDAPHHAIPGELDTNVIIPGELDTNSIIPGEPDISNIIPDEADPSCNIPEAIAGSSRNIRGETGLSRDIRDEAGPSRDIRDEAGPSRVIRDEARPCRDIRDEAGPSLVISNEASPTDAISDEPGPSHVIYGKAGSSRGRSGNKGAKSSALVAKLKILLKYNRKPRFIKRLSAAPKKRVQFSEYVLVAYIPKRPDKNFQLKAALRDKLPLKGTENNLVPSSVSEVVPMEEDDSDDDLVIDEEWEPGNVDSDNNRSKEKQLEVLENSGEEEELESEDLRDNEEQLILQEKSDQEESLIIEENFSKATAPIEEPKPSISTETDILKVSLQKCQRKRKSEESVQFPKPKKPREEVPVQPEMTVENLEEKVTITGDAAKKYCAICLKDVIDGISQFICCDECPRVFHAKCHIPELRTIPTGTWQCFICIHKDKVVDETLVGGFIDIYNISQNMQMRVKDYFLACKFLSELYGNKESLIVRTLFADRFRSKFQRKQNPVSLCFIRERLTIPSELQFGSLKEVFVNIGRMMYQAKKLYLPKGNEKDYKHFKTLEAVYKAKLERYFPEAKERKTTYIFDRDKEMEYRNEFRFWPPVTPDRFFPDSEEMSIALRQYNNCL